MHPLLVAIIFVLSLGSSGYAKETISDSSSDHDLSKDSTSELSRTKRGSFNFQRWNRGLQMLRLGKRDGPNVLEDDMDNDHNPFYSERDLLGAVDGHLFGPYSDNYHKRTLNMLRLGKRQLGMLRLGKRDGDDDESDLSDGGAEGDDSLYKRTLNMLRLGKRHMQMLRLGRGFDKRENDGDAESALDELRLNKNSRREDDGFTDSALGELRGGRSFDKRNLNVKRHMQMLRLGRGYDKRENDGEAESALDELRHRGDRSDKDITLGELRGGRNFDKRNLNTKRHMQMLRLGRGFDKRENDAGAESALDELRLNKNFKREDRSNKDITLGELRGGRNFDKRNLDMKRHMQMLRLGRGFDKRENDADAESALDQLRYNTNFKREDDSDTDIALGELRGGRNFDKRGLNMLRLGKRHMQMLRLGRGFDKESQSHSSEDQDYSKEDDETVKSYSSIRRGKGFDKRNLNMLRLGKRDGDNKSTYSI